MNKWTDNDISILKENYPNKGKIFCANLLNKSESSIRAKASELKLKQNRNSKFFKDWQTRAKLSKIGKKRPDQALVMKKLHQDGKMIKDEKQCKDISTRMKKWIKENGHPKGMFGKNHNMKTKEKLSSISIKMWKNPDFKLNGEDHKQKLSDRMSILQNSGVMRNRYSNGRMGTYNINGKEMFFRSLWEVNYALYLDFLIKQKQIKSWEYEKDTFWFEAIRRGVRSYKPDFKIFNNNGSIEYHEVKGYMDNKSKTKLSRMKKYYPDVKLILVEKDTYYDLKQKVGRMCGFYE